MNVVWCEKTFLLLPCIIFCAHFIGHSYWCSSVRRSLTHAEKEITSSSHFTIIHKFSRVLHPFYFSRQWSNNLNQKLSFPLDSAESWEKVNETFFQTHMTEWVCPRRAKNKHWWSAESKRRGNRTVSGASEGRTQKSLSDVHKRKVSYFVYHNLKTEWGNAAEFQLKGGLYSEVQLTGGKPSQD